MGPPFWSWCQGGVSISGWMQPAVCWRDLWWNKQLWQRLNLEERLTDVCRKVHGRCTLMDKCSADKDRETKNLWWNDLPTASRPTDEATRWWLGSITKNYFSRTFQEHLAWLCLNSGFIHASEGTEPNKSTFTSQWQELHVKEMWQNVTFSVFNTGFLITTEIVFDLSDNLDFTVVSSMFI